MKKIGILGGSFDPIHLGHISLADDAKKQVLLDSIIFVPAKIQPFKIEKKVTSCQDRLKMIDLAIKEFQDFTTSSYELKSSEISYTYLTMRYMKKKYGEDAKLYFITGTDSFLKIEEWKESQELLENYSFIVGSRPGYKDDELKACISNINNKYGTEIIKITNEQIDISSTDIRQLFKDENGCHKYVSKYVSNYIRKNNLYINTEKKLALTQQKITEYIEENLNKKRLEHTYAVSREAVKLAQKYDEDKKKAEFCGMCHDMYRCEESSKINDMVKDFGLPDKFIDNPDIAHGKIAAYVLKNNYAIDDEDIINAISYHSTGRDGMSKLEKIIYLADVIAEGRDYDTLKETRRLAYVDLDAACLYSFVNTIDYLKKINKKMDENTIEAMNYIKENINND